MTTNFIDMSHPAEAQASSVSALLDWAAFAFAGAPER